MSRLLPAIVVAALLVGCGDESSPRPAPTSTSTASVSTRQEPLPRQYEQVQWAILGTRNHGRSLDIAAAYGRCDGQTLPAVIVDQGRTINVSVGVPQDASGFHCTNLIITRRTVPLYQRLRGTRVSGPGLTLEHLAVLPLDAGFRRTVTVPDLEGLRADQAAQIVCAIGAHVRLRTGSRSDEGTVRQDPAPGTRFTTTPPNAKTACRRPPERGPVIALTTRPR
jgi:hypothetical protein